MLKASSFILLNPNEEIKIGKKIVMRLYLLSNKTQPQRERHSKTQYNKIKTCQLNRDQYNNN